MLFITTSKGEQNFLTSCLGHHDGIRHDAILRVHAPDLHVLLWPPFATAFIAECDRGVGPMQVTPWMNKSALLADQAQEAAVSLDCLSVRLWGCGHDSKEDSLSLSPTSFSVKTTHAQPRQPFADETLVGQVYLQTSSQKQLSFKRWQCVLRPEIRKTDLEGPETGRSAP